MTTTTFFITGASRGFGKSLAIAFAEKFIETSSEFILLARDKNELEETKRNVFAVSPFSRIILAPFFDLSNLDEIESGFYQAAALIQQDEKSSSIDNTRKRKLVLINNAGSGNPVANLNDLKDLISIRSALDLNITSCVWLTTVFLRYAQESNCTEAVVVNVSSLAAVQPFASMGIYSIGKAARDMLHRVVAEENKDGTLQVKTLNYAPGPMDTKLQDEMRSSPNMNISIKSFFNDMAEKNTWVKIDDSAQKLARLIWEDKFTSGSHVDFYDI